MRKNWGFQTFAEHRCNLGYGILLLRFNMIPNVVGFTHWVSRSFRWEKESSREELNCHCVSFIPSISIFSLCKAPNTKLYCAKKNTKAIPKPNECQFTWNCSFAYLYYYLHGLLLLNYYKYWLFSNFQQKHTRKVEINSMYFRFWICFCSAWFCSRRQSTNFATALRDMEK